MTQTRSKILAPEGSGFISPKLTYDQFLHKFYGKHVEYVNAKVIGPMTVDLRHYQLTRFLGSLLQFYVEEKELGVIFGERFQMKMEFQDGIHGREPDVFFVTKENLHRLSDRFYDGGADLVVEIISPDSAYRDTVEKFQEYQTAGVSEYWTIDHNRRTANFYGFDESGKYELLPLSPDGTFSSRVIDGLWIKTDWLWKEPLPRLMDILKEWDLAN